MHAIPATTDSDFGTADEITNAFNSLNGFNHSEPNAADGAQNPSFYTSLTADIQLEINMGDASRNLPLYVVDDNSTATGQVVPYRCKIHCVIVGSETLCKIRCKF